CRAAREDAEEMSGGHADDKPGGYERDRARVDRDIRTRGKIEARGSGRLIRRQNRGLRQAMNRDAHASVYSPPPLPLGAGATTGFLTSGLTSRVPFCRNGTPVSIHDGRGLPSR